MKVHEYHVAPLFLCQWVMVVSTVPHAIHTAKPRARETRGAARVLVRVARAARHPRAPGSSLIDPRYSHFDLRAIYDFPREHGIPVPDKWTLYAHR